MASSLVLTIKTERADPSALAVDSSLDVEGVVGLTNFLEAAVGGYEHISIDLQVTDGTAPVAASATATLVSCATDTITVGKTTFTGTGSPSTALHFETDGDDTADAAALAAAINAHTDTSKIVTATSLANVVTVTAKQKGLVGNHIAFSETGSTITCTGSGFLAGGTGGATSAAKTYSCGLA